MGQLEFRITADPSQPNPQEREIIELAQDCFRPAQKDVTDRRPQGGRMGGLCAGGIWPRRQGGRPQHREADGGRHARGAGADRADAVSVTGEYLRSVSKGVDEQRRPGRQFHLQYARRAAVSAAHQQEHAESGDGGTPLPGHRARQATALGTEHRIARFPAAVRSAAGA